MTMNDFFENTFILSCTETREAIIVDPGCNSASEREALVQLIQENDLNPVLLVNTHCHLDHVFGNAFVKDNYNIPFTFHRDEVPVYKAVPIMSNMYGLPIDDLPEPDYFLDLNSPIAFGHVKLSILFTPGHSPGSVSLYNEDDQYVIAGDVLFQHSIGRTDLPGGDHSTLLRSIRDQLLVLPDQTVVWPGHGPSTTIGVERKSNPFLTEII